MKNSSVSLLFAELGAGASVVVAGTTSSGSSVELVVEVFESSSSESDLSSFDSSG